MWITAGDFSARKSIMQKRWVEMHRATSFLFLFLLLTAPAVAQSGREIPMRAESVCVHSDTPGAPELARAVGEGLRQAQQAQTR